MPQQSFEYKDIGDLVQDYGISIANPLEIPQCCIKPLIFQAYLEKSFNKLQQSIVNKDMKIKVNPQE